MKPNVRNWVLRYMEILEDMDYSERVRFAQFNLGLNPWGKTDWPRDKSGKFLPHVGVPKGMRAWMDHNAQRSVHNHG